MKWIFKILGGMVLFALAFVLFGYVTMYLWNWLMPYLFHLPVVDFYQAIGLVLLGKILFGGMHMGSHWGRRRYWKEKMANMTPDEREKFKSEFAERCRHKWGRVEVKVERTE